MTKDNAPYRAPNFTHKEVETLIYHLELKPELVKPAARLNRDGVKNVNTSSVLTVNDKLKLWEEIATEINKVGESTLTGIVRSATDVKKKWNDLKSRVKTKADDIRKGKLSDKTPLSHLEERVLYLIAKTSHLQGLNGALPPAYLNVIGRRKHNNTASSNSEPVLTEDVAATNTDIEANSVDADADDIIAVAVKQEIPDIVQHILPVHTTMPAVSGIPVITFTAPFNQIIQTPTVTSNGTENARIKNNQGVDSNSKENIESTSKDSKDYSAPEIIEIIYSTQKELKSEIKSIKKIMIRISEQKRKRIEQENEKIQLKKMKLMLKCLKQGLDYDEFITEFM